MKTTRDKFLKLFEVPEIAIPYLNIFVTEQDMDIVVTMDGKGMTPGELAGKIGITEEKARELMEDSYLRSVLNKDENDQGVYIAVNFYQQLNFSCKFADNYHSIPKEVRAELDEWNYGLYKTTPSFEKRLKGEFDKSSNITYLPLDELDEYMSKSKKFRVVPCDCRNLKDACNKPRETCIRFDDNITDRTFGREISKEEAKEIIINAHKKGLMLQVNPDWRENGATGVCNCCACCCYPVRAAVEFNSKGKFPIVEYMACYDEDSCIHCGRCVKRCYFGVFTFGTEEVEIKGKMRKKIVYDPEKCWGCGLCSTTCPTKSIVMKKLNVES
jgi:NAD-dependent dihydropyrimidine dehydrogenase PreA subunit